MGMLSGERCTILEPSQLCNPVGLPLVQNRTTEGNAESIGFGWEISYWGLELKMSFCLSVFLSVCPSFRGSCGQTNDPIFSGFSLSDAPFRRTDDGDGPDGPRGTWHAPRAFKVNHVKKVLSALQPKRCDAAGPHLAGARTPRGTIILCGFRRHTCRHTRAGHVHVILRDGRVSPNGSC